MPKTYNALEGDLTVRGAPSASRSGSVSSVAIVGGYDAANASSDVTAGEATLIQDPTSAEDTFGVSEIPRAAQAVAANGVGVIYGVPVPETSTSETYAASQTLSLTNTPVFNPTFHPDHDIVVEEDTTADGTYDTTLTTNIVYDDAPATPSETDTANVNPINGTIETDASGDYKVSYTYGDYSTAITNAADLPVRDVQVLTESPSVKSSLNTTLSDIANDFDFKRGYTNAKPEIAAADIGNYTPDEQDWRIVEVAPAIMTGADGKIRGCAPVGAHFSSQPISPDGSGLFEDIDGITALNTEYRPSEVKSFSGVTAVTRNGVIGKAETTSTNEQFRLIYATEIIDDVALDLFGVCQDYAGGPQDIDDLETLLEVVCQDAASGNPPQLGFGDDREGDPYDVTTSLGADANTADAGVTIVPYPVAETVNLSLTVSDGFVQFDGAS